MANSNSVSDAHPASHWLRWLVIAVAALLTGGIGWAVWHFRDSPSERAEELLFEARKLRSAGENRAAEQTALEAFELDPNLAEAPLLAAESAASQDEHDRALKHLARVSTDDPALKLKVNLLAAEWNHYHLHRLSDAERSYRLALEIDPEHIGANTEFARLLGLCGRKGEAIPHVLKLIRAGELTDLVALIARPDGVVVDPQLLESASAHGDANALVGLAWHEAEAERFDKAIDYLRQALKREPDHSAAHVALGQRLLDANRFKELERWRTNLPDEVQEFSDYWLVWGKLAERDRDTDGAIRCYWEAARREPESKTAIFRLAHLLAEVGDDTASAKFTEHLDRLQELKVLQDRVFDSGPLTNSNPVLEMCRGYERAGRLWEAYAWCQRIAQFEPIRRDAVSYFQELQLKVEDLPLRLTVDSANVALAVDLSSYPLPRFENQSPGTDAPNSASEANPIAFRNDASAAGLSFRYFNGIDGPTTHRMFEFTGGGVGVIDFDLDGFADVCFSQGCPWPPGSNNHQYRDRLFQNRFGVRFEDVTEETGFGNSRFGQGVTVGDFNSDGFSDIYVANIGANQLWRNNGDGTFSDVTDDVGLDGNEWTTSCVLADLNGDGSPDIYDVNYVTADDVFERICRHPDGSPRACSPFHFDGQSDRLWLSDGQGRFTDATEQALSVTPNGKGLGVAVWDPNNTGRLSLLVANDTTSNFLFVNETSEGEPFRLEERGIASGIGLNSDGKAEGCMGIAIGDIDGDGRQDAHITNFLSESNTLYLNAFEGAFEDGTQNTGLHSPTLDALGFGTQFLDADLDGRLELFVANGHVDDLRSRGKPYAMPPQFFRWSQDRLVEVDADQLGPYFREKWLGRAVARIDWNRDGKNDLLVGHLLKDSALLTNSSPETGHFLSLRLLGVQSHRDAIGTTVTVHFGEQTAVQQLTAGDGYQASNERRLIFGLGQANEIEELTVRWPSGTVQQFADVKVSQELWLVEGGDLLPSSPVNFDAESQ